MSGGLPNTIPGFTALGGEQLRLSIAGNKQGVCCLVFHATNRPTPGSVDGEVCPGCGGKNSLVLDKSTAHVVNRRRHRQRINTWNTGSGVGAQTKLRRGYSYTNIEYWRGKKICSFCGYIAVEEWTESYSNPFS